MWTRQDSGLDVMKGLPLLGDARVRRIAIANPAIAPYGRASFASLRMIGIAGVVERKLVYADNVAQAAQFALSGNVDVAMIGHALALGAALREVGRFYEVPDRMHPPIIQSAGIVAGSRNKAAAGAFLTFLKSADASDHAARVRIPPADPAAAGPPMMDWQAFGLSVRLAAVVSIMLIVLALPLAYWLSVTRFRGRF